MQYTCSSWWCFPVMVIEHHLPRGSAFVATTRCAQSPTAARSTPPGLYAVCERSGVHAVINFAIPNSCCRMFLTVSRAKISMLYGARSWQKLRKAGLSGETPIELILLENIRSLSESPFVGERWNGSPHGLLGVALPRRACRRGVCWRGVGWLSGRVGCSNGAAGGVAWLEKNPSIDGCEYLDDFLGLEWGRGGMTGEVRCGEGAKGGVVIRLGERWWG
eukprot:scaffold23498_cov159-Cylindrotheca_fusiformis.AAC.2